MIRNELTIVEMLNELDVKFKKDQLICKLELQTKYDKV